MKLPLPLPKPKPTEPVVFLLHPEQIAWIRSHAAGNASSFMRRLVEQLMEEEQRELEVVQQQLLRGRQSAA